MSNEGGSLPPREIGSRTTLGDVRNDDTDYSRRICLADCRGRGAGTSASRLAQAVGIPSLIIGLTVVAFGTSAPEFAVSVRAGLVGQADLALGNVVGSNIFNVLFILGVSA